MVYGTGEQKARYLPEIASGEAVYCQGFSEPESGSDLASLQLKAEDAGDDFVLTGSKIWTSGAHRATHCFLLGRTDPNAPKHHGISASSSPMDSPGIEVTSIANMYDVYYFNQIFFDGVRVPKRNLIGGLNRGWYVAATSLDFERSGIARFAANRRSLEELVGFARETVIGGRRPSEDPVIRNECRPGGCRTKRVSWLPTGRMDAERGRGSQQGGGHLKADGERGRTAHLPVGPQDAWTVRNAGESSRWAHLDGRLPLEWMDSISLTIRAGTSEIMRNIVAVRGWVCPGKSWGAQIRSRRRAPCVRDRGLLAGHE